MKRKLKFLIYGSKTEGWKWDLEAPNGTPLASCAQSFKTKGAAVKSVERLQDETESSTIYVNGEVLE